QHSDNIGCRIGAQQGDALALLQTSFLQAGGDTVGERVQLSSVVTHLTHLLIQSNQRRLPAVRRQRAYTTQINDIRAHDDTWCLSQGSGLGYRCVVHASPACYELPIAVKYLGFSDGKLFAEFDDFARCAQISFGWAVIVHTQVD